MYQDPQCAPEGHGPRIAEDIPPDWKPSETQKPKTGPKMVWVERGGTDFLVREDEVTAFLAPPKSSSPLMKSRGQLGELGFLVIAALFLVLLFDVLYFFPKHLFNETGGRPRGVIETSMSLAAGAIMGWVAGVFILFTWMAGVLFIFFTFAVTHPAHQFILGSITFAIWFFYYKLHVWARD